MPNTIRTPKTHLPLGNQSINSWGLAEVLHAVENYVNVHSKFLFGNCDESHVRWKKRHCSQQLNLEDNEQVFMLILTMVCFIFVLPSRLKSGDTSCSTKIEILCKWLRVVKDSILSFSLGIKWKFPEMIWGMRVESRFEMVINYVKFNTHFFQVHFNQVICLFFNSRPRIWIVIYFYRWFLHE